MAHRVLIVVAAFVGLLASCYDAGSYACDGDEHCIYSGVQGRCESIGYCSYGRDTCESGRVWGPHAGDGLAGECLVAPDDGGATVASGDDGVAACEGWIPGDRRRRVPLHIAADERFGELVDFPALVVLDPERIDYDHTAPDGGDLRFADADGNPLPHEIDRWSSSGVSHVWVRLDRLGPSAGTIFMYYDRSSPGDAETTATDVWRADFAAVWHLGNAVADASGHERSLAANPTVGVSGWIGESSRFELVDEDGPRITAADISADLGSPFAQQTTVTLWVRASADAGDFAEGTLFDVSVLGNGAGGLTAAITEELELCFARQYEVVEKWCTDENTVSDGPEWHHLAIATEAEPAEVALYIDGVQQSVAASSPAEGSPGLTDPLPFYIGNDPNMARPFAGDIDEVRLAPVVRSAGWIAAEFATGNDALFEYGPEERCEPE